MIGNRFANVQVPVLTAPQPRTYFERNRVECQPMALGWHAENRGVGRVPAPGYGWALLLRDCDPGSPSFGAPLDGGEMEAEAMPTSGLYVARMFVRNAAPAIENGRVLLGWLRLTTGSGHAAGTDWAPVYADVA